jgi:hypothetical protein
MEPCWAAQMCCLAPNYLMANERRLSGHRVTFLDYETNEFGARGVGEICLADVAQRSQMGPGMHYACAYGSCRIRLEILMRAGEAPSYAPGLNSAQVARAATVRFIRRPIPLISMATSSPGRIQRGGVRPRPTPGGVPVLTISPG